MPELTEIRLPATELLLDPNNYRFQDDPNYVSANPQRFHEQSVQDRTYRRIRQEGLNELKESIMSNGFLPFERLVVRPYGDDGKYVVVEGNRRLAALRWIKEDHDAGVDVPDEVLGTLEQVPVVIIEGDASESLYLSLMGVRHVGGIRQWGGYQRAKLVTQLRDDHGLDSSEIAARLGMSTQEVNRRYRAFKALNQMESDENYQDYATPRMYPLFHEAVSIPVVRDWLGWDAEDMLFRSSDALEQFYQLITGVSDDGEERQPKITAYSQVRELRSILQVPEARRVLLDPGRSFHDAIGIAKRDEYARSWRTQIAEAIGALKDIGALDLEDLSSEDLSEVRTLRELADRLLSYHDRLVSSTGA